MVFLLKKKYNIYILREKTEFSNLNKVDRRF